MISRVGIQSEACIVCARRAGPSGVGAGRWIGWYCTQCGVQAAKSVFIMPAKEFDVVEQAACRRVAAIINSTDDAALTIQREDVALFVSWVVDEFAKQMREYVKTGEAPSPD